MKVRIGSRQTPVALAGVVSLALYVFHSEDLSLLNVDGALAGSRDTSPIRIWDLMPSDERDFITVVNNSATAYRAGQADAREMRAKEICRMALSSKPIEGWVGRVSKVATDARGRISFSLRIAPDIFITTDDEGVVGSSIPSADTRASWLKEGEWLRFFGGFVKNDADCVTEISAAPDVSMTQPQFVFQFKDFFGL